MKSLMNASRDIDKMIKLLRIDQIQLFPHLLQSSALPNFQSYSLKKS